MVRTNKIIRASGHFYKRDPLVSDGTGPGAGPIVVDGLPYRGLPIAARTVVLKYDSVDTTDTEHFVPYDLRSFFPAAPVMRAKTCNGMTVQQLQEFLTRHQIPYEGRGVYMVVGGHHCHGHYRRH
jgi:hypothetical protein